MKKKTIKFFNVLFILITILGIFTTSIGNTYNKIPVRNVVLDNNNLSSINYFEEFESYTLNNIKDQKRVTFTGYNEVFLSDLYEFDLVSKASLDRKVQTKYDCVYDYNNELVTINVTLYDANKTTIIDSMQGDLIKNNKGEFDVVFNIDGERLLLSEIKYNGTIDNVGFFSSLKRLWKSTVGKIGTIVTVAACAVVGVVCAVVPGGQLVTAVCIGATIGAIGFGTTAAAVSYKEDGKIDWDLVANSFVAGAGIGTFSSAIGYGIGNAHTYVTRGGILKYGDTFGKLGTYVKNPKLNLSLKTNGSHITKRMTERGIDPKLFNEIIKNGKTFKQSTNKFLFITEKGAVVVKTNGEVITAYSRNFFDRNIMKLLKILGLS